VEQQPAEGSSDAQGELAADRKLLNQVMTEWILMRAGSRRTGILLRFCSLCARCGAPNAPDPLWWVLRWRSVPPAVAIAAIAAAAAAAAAGYY
jgi:hypothetical protein